MEKPPSLSPSSILARGTPNALRYCHTAQIYNKDFFYAYWGLYCDMIHMGNGICKR